MQVEAELLIRLDATGEIHVTGPLGNTLLCYGMLERARDVVRAAREKINSSAIVAPTNGDVLKVNRG